MLENTDKEPSNTQSHKGWTWFHMFLCLQPGMSFYIISLWF